MYIAAGTLLILIGTILIWFYIPYSPIKNDFKEDTNGLIAENKLQADKEIFVKEDFAHFPSAIQKYIENCGYIGTQKISYMKMEYHDVTFMQNIKGPALTINYTQYNFVNEPSRMAMIDSSIYGIPFEGYDYYQNGKGGMKGVIGKVITLFDQTGTDMDKACLATFLAESLFAPTILLQDYIIFEEINNFEVRATITFNGQTVSGIFTFNQQYEMISFTTNDRSNIGMDGMMENVPWSACCGEYKLTDSGIKYPTKFQAVWKYPNEDFLYFDGIISGVSYDVN